MLDLFRIFKIPHQIHIIISIKYPSSLNHIWRIPLPKSLHIDARAQRGLSTGGGTQEQVNVLPETLTPFIVLHEVEECCVVGVWHLPGGRKALQCGHIHAHCPNGAREVLKKRKGKSIKVSNWPDFPVPAANSCTAWRSPASWSAWKWRHRVWQLSLGRLAPDAGIGRHWCCRMGSRQFHRWPQKHCHRLSAFAAEALRDHRTRRVAFGQRIWSRSRSRICPHTKERNRFWMKNLMNIWISQKINDILLYFPSRLTCLNRNSSASSLFGWTATIFPPANSGRSKSRAVRGHWFRDKFWVFTKVPSTTMNVPV